jgi:hypothetical protein
VAEIEHGMSGAEFEEWQEFERMEWFGDRRADLRMATLAALLANINRDSKKRPQPYSARDFMPFEERPRETSADLSARLRAAFSPLIQATQEG